MVNKPEARDVAAVWARKSSDDSDKNEEARSTTSQIEPATTYAQSTCTLPEILSRLARIPLRENLRPFDTHRPLLGRWRARDPSARGNSSRCIRLIRLR